MSTASTSRTLSDSKEIEKPRLWIKRLVIFESPQSIETPVRDIPFSRGLNIIWGVELPDDAGVDSAHPVTLSGHSVGKTTLCRLIRYCLGESTFGNQGAVSRIRNAFAEAWVGIQVEVEGQDWAVLKPIGLSGNSKAALNSALEELFTLNQKQNHFGDFMAHLRKAMLPDFHTGMPPNSDRPFEWKHLLAWLTRDQEARFQSIHEWRSSRSDSDTLQFKNPKEDPLYLIRLILGLVKEQEFATTLSLKEAKHESEETKKRISELKREPEYRFVEHGRILHDLLGEVKTEEYPDDGLFSLEAIAWQLHCELETEIARFGDEIEKSIETEIRLKTLIKAEEDELGRICAEIEAMLKSTERSDSVEKPKELEDQENRLGDKCRFGRINYSNCEYFKKRLMELREKIVHLSEERQQAFIRSGSEDRIRFIEELEGEHLSRTQSTESWKKQLAIHKKSRGEQETKKNMAMASLRQLDYHIDQRKLAHDLIEGRTPNTEIQREIDKADELGKRIEALEKELQQVQITYGQRLATISSIYDGLIKKALSDSYSGSLHMTRGELQFHISETAGLSGEAVETLALVLADVAAMECSCNGIGGHPRFLLHDSPREADLDRHIYNRYLRAMWDLTEEHGGKETAPFQYIVTTTSRPPDNLEAAIRLRLEGHPDSNMLFKRILKNVEIPETKNLFMESSKTSEN